jgi:hypothetical protein
LVASSAASDPTTSRDALVTPPKLTTPRAASRSTSTVAPSALRPIVTSVGYGEGAATSLVGA